jgi:hypothetical protein
MFAQCDYCSGGNWICFGDVYLSNGKLSSSAKCQSCVILRKPCKGGIRKFESSSTVESPGTLVVRPPAATVSPVRPYHKVLKVVGTSSSDPVSIGTVYDSAGVSLGWVSKVPAVGLASSSLSRKRSALSPPSSGEPSSSKILRSAKSSSAIVRTSSAMSTSTSLPSPLVFSPSLPAHLPITLPVLPARMVVDPPEDQVLLLLDALEFAIDKGNLGDARNRIRALRKLRRLEKGYPGV